jgi:hypothetical protein
VPEYSNLAGAKQALSVQYWLFSKVKVRQDLFEIERQFMVQF